MQPEPRLRPEPILRALLEHGVEFVVIGGFAATLHGSPAVTFDIDIVPKRDVDNLERLSKALHAIDARIWTQPEPQGLPFDHDAKSLRDANILNLITEFGR